MRAPLGVRARVRGVRARLEETSFSFFISNMLGTFLIAPLLGAPPENRFRPENMGEQVRGNGRVNGRVRSELNTAAN